MHVLGLELLVIFEDPSHQSQTSQASTGYLMGLYCPTEIFQANLQTLFELTYMTLFLFHLILVHYPPALMELCWQQCCANLSVWFQSNVPS